MFMWICIIDNMLNPSRREAKHATHYTIRIELLLHWEIILYVNLVYETLRR